MQDLPVTPRRSAGWQSWGWHGVLLGTLALVVWLGIAREQKADQLARTTERLARAEARLEQSQREVHHLKEAVEEVKEMVGTLTEDADHFEDRADTDPDMTDEPEEWGDADPDMTDESDELQLTAASVPPWRPNASRVRYGAKPRPGNPERAADRADRD